MSHSYFNNYYTVPFIVSPTAWWLAIATADSSGPGQKIESNTPAAWQTTIE